MFATLISFALLATTSVFAFDVKVADTAEQCGNLKINWGQKTDGPYFVEILNPDDPCGDAITTLGDHDGKSMTWYGVNLVAGTKIQVYVESENDEGWSAPITVTDGLQDCLDKSLWSTSAEPSSTEAESSSVSASTSVSEGTATLTPSIVASSVRPTASASGNTPAIVGAAGAEPGQGDGAMSVKAAGSVMAFSAFVAVALL